MKQPTHIADNQNLLSLAHWLQQRRVGNLRLNYVSWLAVLTLFLVAQTISVLHSSVHPFHEHTQLCDAVEKAADPRIDASPFVVQLPKFQPPIYQLPVYRFTPPPAFYSAFQSRAPPFFSV
ncbi:hypothetical protein J3998_06810 [Thiomicrorhabdus sp. 6S2-11]|uniref:Uncharacterized protein n=1 Tax=Thiomicrorhabdus marina TaxID=2818442 RepID=A0ABS3Q4N1_9GAMM|nr:hypothetical protein [Thiomicrorhabdus marina]MBO1927285.1 hypothetical protein [Thiomicrorhabdus marina]